MEQANLSQVKEIFCNSKTTTKQKQACFSWEQQSNSLH